MRKRLTAALLSMGLLTVLGGCTRATIPIIKESPGEKLALSVLAGQSTSDAGMEDLLDEWMAQRYPDVRLDWECVDWGESFDSQLKSHFATGDVPDIIVGKAQDAQTYWNTGNLAPIPDTCTQNIKPTALDAVTAEGTTFGLPVSEWYQGVIYNKALFAACGVAVPKTPRELESVCVALLAQGITPFASHYNEAWSLGNTNMQLMVNEFLGDTPDWGDQFRAGKRNYSDDPAIRRCMENSRTILENSWDDALRIDQFEADKRFANGEAAMYLTGSWSLQLSNQYSEDDNFGIFPYPNAAGDAKLLRETNVTFMMSSRTPHAELITRIFQDFLSDSDIQREILDYTQTQSVMEGFQSLYHSCIQEDVEAYERAGQVVDVSIGNRQMVWFFQNAVAAQQLSWLRGEASLEDVLAFADENRAESAD